MVKSIKSLRESFGTASHLGAASRKKPRKAFYKASLGGDAAKKRAATQASGNQHRSPNMYEEMVKKVKAKLSNKASPVIINPEQDELKGFY